MRIMSVLVRIGGVIVIVGLACAIGLRDTKHHVPVASTSPSVGAPSAPSLEAEAPLNVPREPEAGVLPAPALPAPNVAAPRADKVDLAHVPLCRDIRVRGIVASASQRWSFAFLSSLGAPSDVVRTG